MYLTSAHIAQCFATVAPKRSGCVHLRDTFVEQTPRPGAVFICNIMGIYSVHICMIFNTRPFIV